LKRIEAPRSRQRLVLQSSPISIPFLSITCLICPSEPETMDSRSPLVLPMGVTENDVRVHPVALFTICDAFIRRSKMPVKDTIPVEYIRSPRVIGTLLGTICDGHIEIKECYAVPHNETVCRSSTRCPSLLHCPSLQRKRALSSSLFFSTLHSYRDPLLFLFAGRV
jgi:hypothetical protein